MGGILSTLDLVIFFGSLLAVMAIGLWAGRKEDTSEDFYLAGRRTRWWGVAGSIFGSNVSANHLVGMMGVGFMYGFAQSHFEITAICGLLMLCYVFLPVYRKLNVYTLSEYLSKRYNDWNRVAYALIMVIIMVVIQMVPGFYIGSRSVNILLQGDTGKRAVATATVSDDGRVTSIELQDGGYGYVAAPEVVIALPPGVRKEDSPQRATAVATIGDIEQKADAAEEGDTGGAAGGGDANAGGDDPTAKADAAADDEPSDADAEDSEQATPGQGVVLSLELADGGSGYDPAVPPDVRFVGGSAVNPEIAPGNVDPTYYMIGIILIALVTGTYTIIGGLRAVIITDVIQSVLLLGAGLTVAFITFAQPEVGGWMGMVEQDLAMPDAKERLHLYNPSNHPGLPWTGVLTGLMVLHFYYWGTNQFIVQRALSATTDREARLGIISAGFFKLLIPFFSIGTGIAAFFLFRERKMDVAQDVVFIKLLTELIAPIGFGLIGLIAAGMFGAILSSLDSMMNSSATIFTFDIYRRYMRPNASEKELIWIGRLCIVVFIAAAAYLTIVTMGANSEESFFLHVANYQGKLVAGVVVAFLLGMMWRRASALGGFVSIAVGVALSFSIETLYLDFIDLYKTTVDGKVAYEGFAGTLVETFGVTLNFFHAAFLAAVMCVILHVLISLALWYRSWLLSIVAAAVGGAVLAHPLRLVYQWFIGLFKVEGAATYEGFGATIVNTLGVEPNAMVVTGFGLAIGALLLALIMLSAKPTEEKSGLTWKGLGVFDAAALRNGWIALFVTLALYATLAVLIVPWASAEEVERLAAEGAKPVGALQPIVAAWIAAGWTCLVFFISGFRHVARDPDRRVSLGTLLTEDRFYAGLLAGCAIFMMYYFF